MKEALRTEYEKGRADAINGLTDTEKEHLWIKSLKPTYWKPSWEQLDALQYVYRNINPPLSDKLGWDSIKQLELLYHDLKKL